jgi:hypothetical protein
MSDDVEYYIIGRAADVRDKAGNSKSYSTQIGVPSRNFEEIVTNEPNKVVAILSISKEGKKGVFSDDIDWRCTTCGDRASTTCVSVAAFHKFPPRIIEYTFFPVTRSRASI